ncbi:MAG: GNAT family N-acetyltransferase [Maricaulaceae bacterium]
MIAPLRSEHAERAAVIHAESFETGWSAETLSGHINNDLCLGISQGDELCGFIILRSAADQADIVTIAIAKTARRKGLANRLLEAAEQTASQQGVELIFLEVAEDNAAAIALYKSARYDAIGKRPAYYRRENGRVAALTFRKTLIVS